MKARVLVVEDQALVAMALEEILEFGGYHVAGTVTSAQAAIDFAPDAYDCAIVDMNLDDGSCEPFATALRGRGTPFIYATGTDTHDIEGPAVAKPYTAANIIDALDRLPTAAAAL